MLDKFIYNGLHFIMKWAGMLNAWAWREHTKILRNKHKRFDEIFKPKTLHEELMEGFKKEQEELNEEE